MPTNASIVRRSPRQLRLAPDYSQPHAPSRPSLGADFWSSAVALYPSRGRRTVKIRLDPEVTAHFLSPQGGGLDAINAVLRAHVEAKRASAARLAQPTRPPL